jgi:hypothetical protein
MNSTNRPVTASRGPQRLAVAVFAIALAGTLLALVLMDRFVFHYAAQYRSIGGWVFLLLLPGLACVALSATQYRAHLRQRYPTALIRRFVMWPLSVTLAAGALVVAPLGWLGALAWAFGEPQPALAATVSAVEDYRASRKGCKQHMTLNIAARKVSVCLAKHYHGPAPLPGQRLSVATDAVSYGYIIGTVAEAPDAGGAQAGATVHSPSQ